MFKLRLLFVTFILAFLLVIGRLFYFQFLVPKNSLETLYLQTKKIFPERGKIYDRNGLPLAANQTTYSMYFEPKKIKDDLNLIKKIDEVIKIGESTLSAKIDKTKDWVAVSNDLDKDIKDKISKLNLSGVGFEEGSKRFYPEASLAAHVMGFVGKNYQGDTVGYFGVEGYYDKDLAGFPGMLKTERDLLGRPIFIGTQEKIDQEDGRDLYLTIDRSIQAMIKQKLIQGMENYQASEGCIIVANPETMEILGLSCLPDFDVDKYYSFSESFFKNPAISNLYEPGSIFKPLIMAAALEEKAIKKDDTYNEEGPIKLGEYSIQTWNNKYEGKISMTRILEKSSNVGMVYVGEKLGQDKIYQYLKKYGFDKTTGIDLQGETASYFKPKNSWYPIDFSTVTFGQGIAVTPIQMIRAFAALINGGKLLKPEIVKKIVSGTKASQIKPQVERQVISEVTSAVIRKMLWSTVENGEMKWAKPKGYQVGGKTGTAQIPIKGHYDPTKTIASFIGFAPVDNPKFIALVMLKEPKSSPWGSETAAPLFFDVAKELLLYYNIAPESNNID